MLISVMYYLTTLFIIIQYYYYYICLMTFFQDNLGKPAPEKQNHFGKTNLDLL